MLLLLWCNDALCPRCLTLDSVSGAVNAIAGIATDEAVFVDDDDEDGLNDKSSSRVDRLEPPVAAEPSVC